MGGSRACAVLVGLLAVEVAPSAPTLIAPAAVRHGAVDTDVPNQLTSKHTWKAGIEARLVDAPKAVRVASMGPDAAVMLRVVPQGAVL